LKPHFAALVLAAAAGLYGCRAEAGGDSGAGADAERSAPAPAPVAVGPQQQQQPVIAKTTTQSPAPSPAGDPVVARVGDVVVTMGEIQPTLLEAYGLNVLLNRVRFELAQQMASKAGVTVTDADYAAEREQTFSRMFQDASKEDWPQLQQQFFEQQRITGPEFELVLRLNATLRKIAEPALKDSISEANLETAFRAMYGEKVKVRHIQGSNLQEMQDAKRKLAAGEPFERVAEEMSRNAKTAAVGGLLPEFSRATTDVPQSFKDAAFSLKEGEVSDPVQANNAYHIIRLDARIAPKAVKFEDVKDSIRQELYNRAVQATVRELRAEIDKQARESLIIEHPELKRQFDERAKAAEAEVKGRDGARNQLERERKRLTTRPATAPLTSAPTTAPARPLPDAAP